MYITILHQLTVFIFDPGQQAITKYKLMPPRPIPVYPLRLMSVFGDFATTIGFDNEDRPCDLVLRL